MHEALSHAFDEGDLVNLFQCSQPDSYFIQSGLTQEPHALIASGSPALGSALLQQNHFADTVAQIEQLVDGSSPAESRPSTFNAALSFIEVDLRPHLRIEAAGLENPGGIVRFRGAGFENQPHQPLRQNAVQSRNEVVRLNAHVEKAPNDIDHVISVDSCENQVTGERGLNRDLRRLRVADFPNHDLVGIVTQDGAQSASEGQTFFLIDRDLGDATNLVFDRVFNGDDFVFVGLDLADRCVQGRGLAASGWSGDQHHAVRFLDVAAEFPQVVFIETHHIESEFVKFFAHRFFIEHAQHGILAVDGRHNRNAEVDRPLGTAVAHAEASVLRNPALGDIQFTHHFDTRDDGRVVLLGDGRHGLGEHAVEAELDAHGVIAGFDMNVTGPPLQSGEDRSIDETNDGADIALLGGQPVDGDPLVPARLVFVDHIQGKAFAGVFENPLGLFRLLEDFGDLGQGRNLGDDALAEQQADLVDHHQLAGVGDGDGEPAILGLLQRHEVVAKHQVDWNGFEKIVVQLEIMQVDELAAVAPRDVLRLFQFLGVGAGRRAPVPAHEYCFVFGRACHFLTYLHRPEPYFSSNKLQI